MKRINSILPIAVLSMIFGAFGCIHNEAKQIKATDGDTTTLGVQSFIKNIWNNDGNAVSTDAFTYNIGWGSLEVGEGAGSHGFHAFTKDTFTEGNFTSVTDAAIDWGAARFLSLNDNRVMLTIKAKCDLEITTSLTSFAGGKDNSEIKYYVIQGDINNGVWYDSESKGLMKTVALDTATAEDAGYVASLSEGDTLVFEWGFRWDGWVRNLEVVNSGLSFAIKQTSEPVVVVNNEKTLLLNYVNDVISYTNGEPYTDTELAPFASFGVYYGSFANGQINKFTDVVTHKLTSNSGNVVAENWQVVFGNNENYILTLTAAEKMLLTVSRPESGTEFLNNSTLNMYKNDELIKSVTFEAEPTSDLTAFDCVKVLNAGDTFTFELAFQWDLRTIAMKSGGSIETSMPQFKGEGFTNAQTNLHETHSLEKVDGESSTCAKNGFNDYYKCSICDEYFVDDQGATKIENLATWKEGDGAKAKLPHTIVPVSQVNSSCSEYGVEAYYKCSECDACFEDQDGNNPIADLAEWKAGDGKIEKADHSLEPVSQVNPTCTESGVEAYYKCSECDACFEDEDGNNPIDDLAAWKAGNGKIEALGHTMVETPEVPATFDDDGCLHYYQCSTCEKYFEDEDGVTPIEDIATWKDGDGKISAKSREFDTPVVTWVGDQCTATAQCTNDPQYKVTETVTGVLSTIKEATCAAEGEGKYVATFTKPELPATAESETFTIEKLPHTYGNWTVVTAPTEEAAGLRSKQCSECDHIETEEIPLLSEKDYTKVIITEPTTTSTGEAKYTSAEYGTFTVEIPQLPLVNNVNTLYFGTINSVISYQGGDEYSNEELAPFASYGVYYGSVAKGEFNKFTNVEIDNMVHGTTVVNNWRVLFGKGENYILKLKAAEKMLLTVSRPESGTEFLKDSTLNMYKNDELIKSVTFEAEPKTDLSAFNCVKVLNAGDTFTFELEFEWDIRNIAMKDGGSLTESLPQFKGEGFEHATTNLHESHALVKVDKTESTCTKAGHNAYYKCSICDECFEDAEGKTPIENITTWLAGSGALPLGTHQITPVAEVAATCTTDGVKAHYKCSSCEQCFEDAEGTKPININEWKVGEGKIPANGHDIKEVTKVDAICENNGHIHYYECSHCHEAYEDAEGKVIISNLEAWLEGDGKLPALGHKYGEPVVVWNGDQCTVTVTCENDPTHVITQTVTGVATTIKEATCEEDGQGKYVATFTKEGLPATQESSVYSIPKLNHSYGEWTVTVQPTETSAGTRTRICSRCQEVETQQIPALTEENYTVTVLVEATTSNSGLVQYSSTEYGTYEVVIPQKPAPSSPANAFGCGGSIVGGSLLISAFMLCGVGLLLRKKEEK